MDAREIVKDKAIIAVQVLNATTPHGESFGSNLKEKVEPVRQAAIDFLVAYLKLPKGEAANVQ